MHQRQLAAEEGQAEGLQQGCQTTGKQRCGDQQADFRRCQSSCLTEDQGYGNNTAIHGQNVLQAVRQVGT
ncbi:hypothetical protein D3C81_1027720 [compost metagenome]